MESSFRK